MGDRDHLQDANGFLRSSAVRNTQNAQNRHTVFGVMGGDRRQVYLARSLAEDGYETLVSCMEQAADIGLVHTEPELLGQRCDVVVLPLPATRDGQYLNTPLSLRKVPLDDGFARLMEGKKVFGGMLAQLTETSSLWQRIDWQDYYQREELVMGNAFLTAEGAIGLAIHEYEGSLGGAQCLVTGYGRIGKALCAMLKGMGAQVFCAARKPADRTAIQATGCQPLCFAEAARPFDLVFNTVPVRVLGAEVLRCQRRDSLLMELASSPGGIDLEVAGRLGLRVLPAPSLPGKMSPKASGELIKRTVYRMMEE
ncbi:dipicolinate synthase subunit DpsA [Acutalibacter caecimuris]|uniref:dipicolinate synthase subunit DpsA n=1 Tax=Acutalibacter caecimuris TaxID=3093657 RepID=UPI002AC90C65|nr:dipicolinate synthase subunit DpsA [Acutalibacter sp. M00118]